MTALDLLFPLVGQGARRMSVKKKQELMTHVKYSYTVCGKSFSPQPPLLETTQERRWHLEQDLIPPPGIQPRETVLSS
ncbi:unnamed protein product [Caretta caretta]